MKKIDNLAEVLEKHQKWLRDEQGGERANLNGARLDHARLDGANLDHANLVGANLDYARLDGASLDGANLDHARLDHASLDGASLDHAILVGANLVGANLVNASLVGANLNYARLDHANLDYARLDYANLDGASLDYARLDGASLDGANLDHAILVNARLVNASLVGANLVNASLVGASGIDKVTLSKWLPDLYILRSQPPKTKLYAYKFLNKDMTSPYQHFKYEIGQIYTCDDFDDDERDACGKGLNVATLSWCKRNKESSQIIVEVSFLAGDIVAIPFATDGKFRVKKMKVERIYTEDKQI